ncbi:MAG: STAS domain-containing protein [Cyanobacteria bacterium P01_F01_bin.53]
MSDSNVVIQPDSSLDVNSSEALRREIVDTIDRGPSSILVDCQAITFMDSSGLSAMVMALKLSKEAGIRFALCSVGEQANMLFQLTGMDQVFEMFDDRAAFENSIAQPA